MQTLFHEVEKSLYPNEIALLILDRRRQVASSHTDWRVIAGVYLTNLLEESVFLHIGRVLNSLYKLAAEGGGSIDPSAEVDELCAGDAHGLVVAGPCVSGNVVVARALRVEQQPVLHVSERSNC